MPSVYQPRRGGSIEVVSDKRASEVVLDSSTKPDSTELSEPEEKFINEYIQQNSKRIQSASSSVTTVSSSLSSSEGELAEQQQQSKNNQRQSSRRASARRLFEVNEWEEEQKRLKQKLQKETSSTNCSYKEIKATTEELLREYDQLISRYDFETHRRREFIYRNYRCHVREPFLLAKIKQLEQLDKTRTHRNRFKSEQYNQFLQFINKHRFITDDNYDKGEYDAMAQYHDQTDEIRTRFLPDPTLLPYHKWMNERRTISSLGCRSQTQRTADPRRVVSEAGFRYYHRTATPLSDGRTSQSALSWQMCDLTNIESPLRRLASGKCYHIEQKSQNPIDFDPVDRSFSYLRHRSASSSSAVPTRNCTPINLTS